MPTSRARGRTQADRTAATRRTLIDATVNSLIKRGFARTTTTTIAQDAGVSLGALSHHFPSKSDLLIATVADLLQRRQEEFRKSAAAVADQPDRVEKVIDLLWAAFSGPTFVAWVELWVGGRRDPKLAPAVLDMQEQFNSSSRALFRELFPPQQSAEAGLTEASMWFAFSVMEGTALKAIAGDPVNTTPVDILKAVARSRNAATRDDQHPRS